MAKKKKLNSKNPKYWDKSQLKEQKVKEKRLNQDEKLLKNIEEYDKKEKAKQQESKVLGQKPIKGKTNKEKSIYV